MYIWILIITLYCVSWIKGNPNENNEKIEKDIQQIIQAIKEKPTSDAEKSEKFFKKGNQEEYIANKKKYFNEVIVYGQNALNENDFGNLDLPASATTPDFERAGGDMFRTKTSAAERKNKRQSTLLLKTDEGDLGGLVRRPTMKPFRHTHQVSISGYSSKRTNSDFLGSWKRR